MHHMTRDPNEFVRRARARLKLSRKTLGDLLGIGRHSVWRYETQRYPVPEAIRLAIKQLLAEHKRKK
jgi:DNA-binding XRE family transcriptional regulator